MAVTIMMAMAVMQWVKFDPRYARLLLLLQEQWQHDQDLQMPAEDSGWTDLEILADRVSEVSGYRPEVRSLSTYLAAINRKGREQLSIELIEYGKNLGPRLRREIRVVVGRAGDVDWGEPGLYLYLPTGRTRAGFLGLRRADQDSDAERGPLVDDASPDRSAAHRPSRPR